MAITTSPLSAISNKIISTNRRSEGISARTSNDYRGFATFLENKTVQLNRVRIPDSNKISGLSRIDLINVFGSISGLLNIVLKRSNDLKDIVNTAYTKRGQKIDSNINFKSSTRSIGVQGENLKIGGVKALATTSALVSSLDSATGLQEGEAASKAVSESSGALVGSLLGGIIGKPLTPVSGLGFVFASGLGGFAMGYAGASGYNLLDEVRRKQEEKIKDTSGLPSRKPMGRLEPLITNIDNPITKFGSFVNDILSGKMNILGTSGETRNPTSSPKQGDLNLEQFEATGGETPGTPDSPYGWRNGRMHNGVDYSKPVGTPISVIQPGLVTVADMNYDPNGWGALVEIRHSNGSRTRYAHLSRINVKSGDQVAPGQVIGSTGGLAGASGAGNSTGPHLHFEYINPSGGFEDPARIASQLFKFGGNIRVTRRGLSPTSPITSELTPGRIVSTPYGQQSSLPTMNYGESTIQNIKGYIIVPGHIAGGGAESESVLVERITKNLVSKLKAKYPDIPIRLWNQRNYPKTDSGFQRQMNDLHKLEKDGWQVIELHLDAPMRDGNSQGGRGVILPYDTSKLSPFDVEAAKTLGAYPLKWRTEGGGLAGPRRGITLLELGNVTNEVKEAIIRNDPSVVEFFTKDPYSIFESLYLSGKMKGSVRAAPPRALDLRSSTSTSTSGTSMILAQASPVILTGGGTGQSRPIQVPVKSNAPSIVAGPPTNRNRNPQRIISNRNLFRLIASS